MYSLANLYNAIGLATEYISLGDCGSDNRVNVKMSDFLANNLQIYHNSLGYISVPFVVSIYPIYNNGPAGSRYYRIFNNINNIIISGEYIVNINYFLQYNYIEITFGMAGYNYFIIEYFDSFNPQLNYFSYYADIYIYE